MTSVLILGAGGTGLDALDILAAMRGAGASIECVGFLDDDPAKAGTELGGVPVLGPLADAARHRVDFVDCLGGPGSFRERPRVIEELGIPSPRFRSLVHPTAVISPSARLEPGCVIYPLAHVGARATIGAHGIMLSQAVVNHHSTIGEYSILASGAIVAGHCGVGAACYLGAGSTLRNGITVGAGTLVGMGATVVNDVPEASVVYGTPAKEYRG